MMTTNQKLRPCLSCKSDDYLAVNNYDGWRHVECERPGCMYLGPGEGSIRAAIKAHNAKVEATKRPTDSANG